MNDDWSAQQHTALADMLTGKVKRALISARKSALKVRDWELQRQIDKAIAALPELKGIMVEAYATRVAADYNPETGIQYMGSNRFSLNGIEITKAHQWQERLETLLKSVEAAWEQMK